MPQKKLEALGYFALGFGFIVQGAKAAGWIDGEAREAVHGFGRPLGRMGPEAEAMLSARDVIDRVDNVTVLGVKDRVSHIQQRIREDSLKPIIRQRALAVLTRKEGPLGDERWTVPEKDHEAEVVALFNAVRDAKNDTALRYTRDHLTVDQFHSADKLLQLKAGDCDDGVILLGSMLRSVGFPIRLRVIQDDKSDTWSHIYLLCGLPPTGPTKWVPLDWSMPDKPPGWEAPGAAQVARTGKPSGVVVRLMDFTV